jgi:hypothetical protein
MSNNKQSSVEYFHDAVNDIIANKRPCNSNEVAKILLEAKEMHKEEIINATIYGDKFEGCYGLDSEQYYNETFGGNNEQQ